MRRRRIPAANCVMACFLSSGAIVLNRVGAGRNRAALAGPVGVEELAAGTVDALVRVRAEVIALGLQQIGRQTLAAVPIVERKRGGEGGNGHAGSHGHAYDTAPRWLAAIDDLMEIGVQQQVGETGIAVEGFLDLAEKSGANDAPGAPYHGDSAVVEIPVALLGSLAEQHEALRVRHDFG